MLHYLRIGKFMLIVLTFLFSNAISSIAENSDETSYIVDSMNKKAQSFVKSNFDSVHFYAEKALSLSEESDYTKGKLDAYTNMSNAHLYLNDLDSSIWFSEQILEIALSNKDFNNLRWLAYYRICRSYHYKGKFQYALLAADSAISCLDSESADKYLPSIYNLKGLIYKNTGDFEKAQEQFIEALRKTDDNNHYLKSITLTNLGIVNRNMNQHEKALEFYEKAIDNCEAIHDSIGLGLTFQNIAAVYSDRKEHRKALSYNIQALKIIKEENFERIDFATSLNNIALNYEGLNRLDSAIIYLKKAMKTSIEIEDVFGIADTKINLGRIYSKKLNFISARKSVEEGIKLANSIGADDLLIEGYEVLLDCEVFESKYKSAFKVQKMLIELRDSVYNIERANTINELQEKYESEKKEQQIALLETENELKNSELKQNRLQRNGIVGFAVIITAIAIIILYYYRKTKRAKNKIEMLQREIHHRVKNNLAIIRRLADVSRQNLNDYNAQSAIGELINRIESMTQVHAHLYQKTDITEINFQNYLSDLRLNIQDSFANNDIQIMQKVDASINIAFNKAVPLGLIINELVTNAFKYAKSDTGVKISISAKRQGDEMKIIVSDNGQGLPKNFDLRKVSSYGLKLVSGLIQQLDGNFNIYNNSGTRVEIEIPY